MSMKSQSGVAATEAGGQQSSPTLRADAAADLPLAEFRELLQAPVRERNDIGGVLFGDWVSPPITRLFIRRGISPTVATWGMLVAGLAGAVMLPFGGGYALAAAIAFIAFYVLDCVDGEVARLRGIDRFFWSYPDFVFGVVVMVLFYISLGVYAYLLTDRAWMLMFGSAAALLLLMKKFADVCHVFLTVNYIIDAKPDQTRRYAEELATAAAKADGGNAPLSRSDILRRYGRGLGLLRGLTINFHLSMLVFAVLCVFDLFLGPWTLVGVPLDLKALFLIVYTLLLALHVADYLLFLWRGGFLKRSSQFYRMVAARGPQL